MRSFLLLTVCALLSIASFAQKLSVGSFNKIIFEETFNFNSGQFPLKTTSENYIIIDDGDLFISRNTSSDYSLFAKKPIALNSYRVKTALKLGPSNNKNPYLGLLLNTQLDGKGTVSIEINAKNQYRVRQIQNGKPKFISGTRSNNGWLKLENLKGIEEYNYLDVVVHHGSFDIYINYVYVESYSIPDYQSGGMGFIVSGSSKARVDFAFVYKQGEAVSFEEFTTTNQRLLEIEESLKNLTEKKNNLENKYKNSIDELTIVKNKLSEELIINDELNIKVDSAKSLINDLNSSISEKDQYIESLNKKNKNLENTVSEKINIIDKNNQSIENLKNDNLDLSKDLSISKAEILSLNSDLSNTVIQNTKLIQSSNEKDDEILNIERNLKNKDKEINSLKNKLKSSISQNNNLQSSNNSLEANINSLNSKIENKQNDIATLNSNISQLQKELNSKQKIISSLSSKNNAYLDSLSDFRNTNTTLLNAQNQLQEVKEILDSTKKKVMNLLDEKKLLTAQLNEQKQIAAQFAESYRLEVQKNKQLQKEITFNQSEVSVSNNTKSNTIYRVQIGTFNKKMEFDRINDVTSIPTQNGDYIYITGKFDSYSEAKVRLMQVAELGYKDAYIVKF